MNDFFTSLFKKGKKETLFLLISLISIFSIVSFVNKRTSFFNMAVQQIIGEKANITVNVNQKGANVENLIYLSQGGEEKANMLNAVMGNLKKLKPNYIRIDHIYDFYQVVAKDEKGNITFDWKKLDNEIESITEAGALPFICLSVMPQAIASSDDNFLPLRWEDWQYVVQKTVEHISGKDGLAIDNVYYEVWNEPDLFGEYKLKGARNYLFLYNYASKGAEKAQNTYSFKIGGPATTALYESWFKDFFSYIESSNLRIDFYSWHRYSKNLDDYKSDLENIDMWKVNYPKAQASEFIISETGFSSENDPGYDGIFSAIHTLSLYTVFEDKVKIFPFEIKDGPGDKKYWGRWGMLTNEKFGIPEEKDRFKALEFIKILEGKLLNVEGNGTWVNAIATEKDGIIRLLLVNYDQFGNNWENVPVSFVGLPYKIFNYRKIDFLGKSIDLQIAYDKNVWKTQIMMAPNTSTIIEISPI